MRFHLTLVPAHRPFGGRRSAGSANRCKGQPPRGKWTESARPSRSATASYCIRLRPRPNNGRYSPNRWATHTWTCLTAWALLRCDGRALPGAGVLGSRRWHSDMTRMTGVAAPTLASRRRLSAGGGAGSICRQSPRKARRRNKCTSVEFKVGHHADLVVHTDHDCGQLCLGGCAEGRPEEVLVKQPR